MKRWKQKLAALLAVILVLGGVLPSDGLAIAAKAAATETKTVSLDMSIAYEAGKRYEMKDGKELATGVEASVAEIAVGGKTKKKNGSVKAYKWNDSSAVKDYGTIDYLQQDKNTSAGKNDVLGSDGRYIVFTPKYNGTLFVAGKIGSGKIFNVTSITTTVSGSDTMEAKTGEFSWENTTGSNQQTYFEGIEVKAGTTYYLYSKGAGTDWLELSFTYESKKPVKLEKKTTSLPMSIAYEAGKRYEMKDGSELATGVEASVAEIAVGGKTKKKNGSVKAYKWNDSSAVKDYGTIDYLQQDKNTSAGKNDVLGSDGRYIVFTPKYDGTLFVAGKIGSGKIFNVTSITTTVSGSDTTEAKKGEFSWENTTGSNQHTYFEGIEVKAGTTYYLYSKGAGTDWLELSFTYEVEVSDELPKIELIDGIKAFPTAEGGGMYATGGRGGDVYVVTSLKDDGSEGTLRYGIENAPKEGRTIVFNVGGTIELKKTLKLTNNLTLAGQTAPGEGITIAGYDTNISDLENVIIRYVHFRPGTAGLADGGDSIDALWGRDMDTFIIDHCSFSWNTDECLSTYRGQNGTVQWSIISESLTVSGHSKGRHGYGAIWGSDNTVFQYNLLANHTSRNPRIGGGYMKYDDTEHVARVQVSNNITYNYGYFACYGGGNAYTNYVNNYLKTGPGSRDSIQNTLIDYGETDHVQGVYIAGNVVENKNGKITDNSVGVTLNQDAVRVDTPYEAPGFKNITLRSAEDAYDLVLNKAGVTYPKRDAIDARVVQQVEDNTGFYINTQDEVGGYCAPEVTRDADYDSDMDGIPDFWEDAHGLNKNDRLDSRNLITDASAAGYGYSYLELYMNELVGEVEADAYKAPNPTVTIDLANNTLVKEGESVTVTADVKPVNNLTVDHVDFFIGGTKVATATSTPYSYTYSGLSDGSYDISVRAYDSNGNATQSNTRKLHVNSTAGTGEWTVTDIGNPGVTTTASYKDGVMTLKGAGKVGKAEGSVSGTAYADASKDNYGYVYKKFTGDMELVTKLDSYIIVDNHTYNGIMFRESLDANAASVGLGFSMNKIIENTVWSAFMVNRPTTGGNMSVISETIDSASAAERAGIPFVHDLQFKDLDTYYGIWLKLARKGDSFTGYVSQDGVAWQTVGTIEIDLPDEFYVGLAVDAGEVANDIENYATAKFSNISIYTDFANIDYDVKNLTVNGADRVASGENLVITLKAATGYVLPETIEVTQNGAAVPFTYDVKTGKISLENLSGEYVVKAKGVKRQVTKVSWEEVDEDNLMTVTEANGVITAAHTGTNGALAKNNTTPSTETGYILFPEVNKIHSMSMKIKITDMLETKNPKYTGVFVGVFDIEGNTFNSLGFRTDDGKGGKEALAGYWVKNTGSAGNGSPKQPFSKNLEYTVNFTSNKNGGFKVTFSAEDGSIKSGMDSKEFKSNEGLLNENYLIENGARYGIAIIGATVEISELTYTDHEGNEVYPGAALPDSTNTSISAALDNAISNTETAEEALNAILAYADAEMLMEEMKSNTAFSGKLKELETAYASEKNINVTATVKDEAESILAEGDVKINNAALSVNGGSVNLVIDKATEQVSVDNSKYPQPKKTQLDIKLVDENDILVSLKVPVTITIPVPKDYDLNGLKLLHYAADGSYEEVAFTVSEDGTTITFTISHFSTFVFVGEEKASIVPPAENPPAPSRPSEDDDDDEEDEDDNEKVHVGNGGSGSQGGKFSPKTFFKEGSFIHNILWPDSDKAEEQNAANNADGTTAATDAEKTEDGQVAAGAVVQENGKGGNNVFAIVVVAAVAVLAASGVVLFRKKNEEEM